VTATVNPLLGARRMASEAYRAGHSHHSLGTSGAGSL
jgi:hypothetical protein